ncbi:topoisomerase II [Planosporangium flavigriseum]|uniref:Preprotein translocase SecA n=1 Tax=Planosporangium flavigriseum TaxID=373681 RepID=A0A8J3PKI0_9ACTN|nr:DUF5926 family protein [Planosporangium flavigriseum]NJC64589.1 topoisomerase II [Planosporangium flavigriseum]GIG71928.1 preprotein translocase SecA [Planosporangium flavigriseum]
MSKRAKNSRTGTDAPKRQKVRDIFVPRPFAGMTDEAEWIALRELVPAATAPLRLAPDLVAQYGDRQITLATVLPMAWPAMTKPDGRIFLGLQRNTQSGDVSRDLAVAVLRALETEPGNAVSVPALPGEGPRLQDVLVDGPLEITLHDTYEFWLDPEATEDPNVRASLERANAAIYPTARLAAAPAAYWCQVPDRAHVRWVLPEDEDAALDALARLSAAGGLLLADGTKFAGMFRAHGLLVPVWDVPREPAAGEWEGPVAEFAKRYAEALTVSEPLTAAERRSRQGLLGRQLTIR